MDRFTVSYSGHVQGVGFRFTVRGLTRGFSVGGHVRNLPDGSVEVVAEGEAQEIVRFLSALEDRMSGYIQSKDLKREPLKQAASDFRILH